MDKKKRPINLGENLLYKGENMRRNYAWATTAVTQWSLLYTTRKTMQQIFIKNEHFFDKKQQM